MASASDDFNRADAGSLGANWTVLTGSAFVTSNLARGFGSFAVGYYNAVTFAANHSSQITKAEATSFVGPAVRVGGSYDGYWYNNAGDLYRYSGGAETLISSAPASFVAGDIAKLEANGSVLEFFKNGASGGTQSDATHATGQPGIMWADGAGYADDWFGADLGGVVRRWILGTH